jgi:hypothetical protein
MVGNVEMVDELTFRNLAWDAVNATTKRFVAMGIWPRPRNSRILQSGYDFVYPDLTGVAPLTRFEEWLSASFERRLTDSTLSLAMRLTLRVLAKSQTDEPQRAVFRREAKLLWDELCRRQARLRDMTRILGLRLDAETIRLDEMTSLRSLPWMGELADKWLAGQFGTRMHMRSAPSVHCALVSDATVDKNVGPAFKHMPTYEEECRIWRRDVPYLRSLWRALHTRVYSAVWRSESVEPRLRVALERFNSTYDDGNWVGKIVDLTIALESLLGPASEAETTHRLRLRSAFLLGNGDREARAIYRTVGTVYDIRSRILHGGTPKPKDYRDWLMRLTGVAPEVRPEYDVKAGRLAVQTVRRLVRSLIVGALRLWERDSEGPQWPLPKDFDQEVASTKSKNAWQREFRGLLQEER